ncbi:hypothetical protein [Absidia glauca]|uniref:PH domain-containing protein n=1 Tax=Absidia glauca TaxID=4829 RepID=A0A168T0Q1_ABSGL|nr:hypothetical protein [Absidia glauca]
MTKPKRHSSVVSPPPRPVKSTLRSMTTEKLMNAATSIRRQGRFTEHFDQLPPQELLDIMSDSTDKKRDTNRQRTISTTTTPSTVSDSDSYFPPLQRPLSRKLSTASRRRQSLTHSLSTPPSPSPTFSTATHSTTRTSRQRHVSSSGTSLYRRPSSTLASTVARSAGAHKLSTLFSLNRAAVIITRLEQWLQLIKCVVQWLDETARLHLQISRGYSHRHLPLFQMELQPDQTPAASTLYAGLRLLTTHVADGHHLFGGNLQRLHIPALLRFKRECKEKIRVLRNDPRLLMDELLQRAELTKKSMDQLTKVCQAADATIPQATKTTDPWLANLYVLRQLKREVNEENRLRHLMVPIQKETADFEARLLNTLKPAIQYCCEFLAPGVWDGSADEETAPFQLLMARIVPDHEWHHFYAREEKELVDTSSITKDYLNIHYPNKLHDKVVTLKKGTMQRYLGGRAMFSDRLYVLSQGGYLHQFKLDDKVVPERSIYIPGATIKDLDDCTFEIRLGGGADRSKKVYVIKAKGIEERQAWCRVLTDMAAGVLAIRRPKKVLVRGQQENNNGISMDSWIATSPSSLSVDERSTPVGSIDDPLPVKNDLSTSDQATTLSDFTENNDKDDKTSTHDKDDKTTAQDNDNKTTAQDNDDKSTTQDNDKNYDNDGDKYDNDDDKYDNDDDDDSSDAGSVSTVTRRYSLLPTSSNNQYQDKDDDDDDAASSIYDDAASRLSGTSTHYDDAASSIYFSSGATTSSPSSSRRSSMEFDGYHQSMLLASLEGRVE